jgi:hypothetical protein
MPRSLTVVPPRPRKGKEIRAIANIADLDVDSRRELLHHLLRRDARPGRRFTTKGGSIMKKLALFTAAAVLVWAVQAQAETVKLRIMGTF